MFNTKHDKELAIASVQAYMKSTENNLAHARVDLLLAQESLQKSVSPEKVDSFYASNIISKRHHLKMTEKRIESDQVYLAELKALLEETSITPVKED